LSFGIVVINLRDDQLHGSQVHKPLSRCLRHGGVGTEVELDGSQFTLYLIAGRACRFGQCECTVRGEVSLSATKLRSINAVLRRIAIPVVRQLRSPKEALRGVRSPCA